MRHYSGSQERNTLGWEMNEKNGPSGRQVGFSVASHQVEGKVHRGKVNRVPGSGSFEFFRYETWISVWYVSKMEWR